ncbi:MAG: YeeE/YedE family protein [Thermoleophilia bacterium]|nr:YeeE/YedE family protein [Thermoleophilia bacterium]
MNGLIATIWLTLTYPLRVFIIAFTRPWPVWLGGLLLGMLSVATFAWARPWGIVAGPREWADWLLYLSGVYSSSPELNPLLSSSSVLTLGLIAGAFASALLSRQFEIKVPPPFELLRSAVGGVLMGAGAALAAGCNVGGFFSATSALSGGGLAMMAGLIAGVFLEVRYYYWELEHLRFKRGERRPRRAKPDRGPRLAAAMGRLDFKRAQPFLGAAALLGLVVMSAVYMLLGVDAVTGYSYLLTGGLLLAAVAFGIVLHRSRFAFLQAFREPFISGRAGQVRGMTIAVIVSVLGFAAIKAGGLRPEPEYVASTFWAGSLVGGMIFGFGMPFAGGCGSGCCWRTAEGSLKVAVALFFLAASNSLFQAAINASGTVRSAMGIPLFLPDYISYKWSVGVIVALMGLYAAVMTWNEKTGRLL